MSNRSGNKLIATETNLMAGTWEGGLGTGEKGERIKNYNLAVTK